MPLASRRRGAEGHRLTSIRRMTVRRQLIAFYTVAAVTMCVLAVGAVLASRYVARNQAFREAETTTSRIANFVVAPLLPQAFDPHSTERHDLDAAIDDRLRDGYMVEVMAWDRSGRVVWASDPRDVGRVISVPDEVTAAIDHRVISSDFTDTPEVDHPELSDSGNGFVEVYVPFPQDEQPGLAFEAYYDYSRVIATANLLTRQMLPLILVPLLLLQIIQVPIAASLARRVRRQGVERNLLLQRNLTVSERERVRIATDLHDGPIQDLAGIGYALGAIAPTVSGGHHHLMDTVQSTLHDATESLRRMMVDLYPTDLRAGQLPQLITDLAGRLRARGIEVRVEVDALPDDLAGEIVTTLFKVGREALANVVEHAQANRVQILLWLDVVDADGPLVHLDVIDNGVGLDEGRLDRRSEGHLGLRLLRDRVVEQGGSLRFGRGHDGGTTVRAVLPAIRSESHSPDLTNS